MLTITLLGCGGTMPLPGRALSSCAVTMAGRTVLFDCGEGTQTACRAQHVSLYKIDHICLTHFHGDHIFGLPGLLQSMGNAGRKKPVTVYGPKGLDELMRHFLAMCPGLPFGVKLCELHPGPGGGPMLLPGMDGLRLTAFEAEHRVPCIGYQLQLPRAGRFDPAAAETLGVPRPLWKKLQQGEPVALPDGSAVVPEQVLGPARKGLSVVFCTDSRPCAALQKAAQNVDLLICDATYGDDRQWDKAVEFGHSTFRESAGLAAFADVKRLWLTHYSAAIEDPAEYLPIAHEIFPAAEAGFDGKRLELKFEER